MCIRDRIHADGAAELTVRAVLLGTLLGVLFGASSLYLVLKVGLTVSASIPVSYTHLRAHETVLDLVCRLLLEKKKKTRNSINNTTHHKTVSMRTL